MNDTIDKNVFLATERIKQEIFLAIHALVPIDALEFEHRLDALNWVQSGVEICRVQKPDIPPKHLVVYFVLVDFKAQKILLGDHKNALLWLPSGGHVEKSEGLHDAVRRECFEELGTSAHFAQSAPLFISITQTTGLTAGHLDVNLWFVLHADSTIPLTFDPNEYREIKWFDFANIPWRQTDEHLHRFMNKLKGLENHLESG